MLRLATAIPFPFLRKTMAFSLACFLLFFLTILSPILCKQTYIVHMNKNHKPLSYAKHAHWYSAQLQSLSINAESLLYAYESSFPGFSVSLSPSEAEALRLSPSVVDVYEETVYDLHTTRTPEFLGLDTEFGHSDIAHIDQASQDVIVGVLDTGVWPESASFSDSGMPAVPARWRGSCETGADFHPSSCNRKLIGARSFSKGYRMAMAAHGEQLTEKVSPRDQDGHGTHTASTAAGSPAANASLLGYAAGTARGMAPGARIASYKVCWNTGCFGSDILGGMDAAIADGVDVLSLSLGGGLVPYYRDTIAIGAFAAVQRGIFVSCSAGNGGPSRSSLANVAPWIMTVGAGTLDRDFPAYVSLGDGKRYSGVSLYSGEGMGSKALPLVYNVLRGAQGNGSSSNLCLPGTLDSAIVRGRVVLCDRGVNARVEKGMVVREAGGVAMILANTAENGEELVADSHLLPALAVGRKMGDLIRAYVRSKKNPTALLSFRGTVLDVRPSPVVAAFSSRGPNTVTPEILKPDLIGPGVNILAAWSESAGPTGLARDPRKTKFNIISGTSMSCPHISGVAALLKAAHPDWSPSAIKSALMTTAYTFDNTNSSLRDASDDSLSTPFAHGSGHVDPQKALSPGLVYDITTDDYMHFLCSSYTLEHVHAVIRKPNMTCSTRLSNPGNLNYPSFSVVFGKSRSVVRYSRELTNVGLAGSVYNVAIGSPAGVGVIVKPTRLVFGEVGQKLRYSVTFVSKKDISPSAAFGWIAWSNDQHQVRSPIAYSWSWKEL